MGARLSERNPRTSISGAADTPSRLMRSIARSPATEVAVRIRSDGTSRASSLRLAKRATAHALPAVLPRRLDRRPSRSDRRAAGITGVRVERQDVRIHQTTEYCSGFGVLGSGSVAGVRSCGSNARPSRSDRRRPAGSPSGLVSTESLEGNAGHRDRTCCRSANQRWINRRHERIEPAAFGTSSPMVGTTRMSRTRGWRRRRGVGLPPCRARLLRRAGGDRSAPIPQLERAGCRSDRSIGRRLGATACTSDRQG